VAQHLVLLLLGFCAGVLNVMRAVGMVAMPLEMGDKRDKVRKP